MTSCAASTVATTGRPPTLLRDDALEMFHHLLLAKSFPAGFARVRAHRALGHRTVLITGALDFVVEPLRPLFDEVVCAQLGRGRRGPVHRPPGAAPPHGRGARSGAGRVRGGARASISASPSPTPTRRRTFRSLECVGFPVAVNPEARLATIARRRGWHVEQWDKAGGGARPPLPFGPVDHDRVALVGAPRGHGRTGSAPVRVGCRRRRGAGTMAMKGLVFERNLARFAASRVASVFAGSGRGAGVGPLHLTDVEPPELPGPEWHRVHPLLAGICGSDLSTVDGRSSRYFEDVVSFPFVPGHEVRRDRSTTPTPGS